MRCGLLIRPTALLAALLLALPASVLPALAQDAREPGQGALRGKIFEEDAKTPVGAATVRAVHLDTNEVFEGAPTTADGKYEVAGLPYGYYNLIVETPAGLYLSNRILNVPPEKKVEASFMLTESRPEEKEWWEAEPSRRVPGMDRPPDGVARIIEKRDTGSFWKSGKGIAVMVGGGALIVGALVLTADDSTSSETPESPSTP
jgi:hypothetical protein